MPDRLPLQEARVLVTRARRQAGSLAARLRLLGATPVEIPMVEIRPPESFRELDEALGSLASFDWIVFTSANGVASVLGRMEQLGKDGAALARVPLCAIGPATARALRARGFRTAWVPESYLSSAIVEGFRARGVAGQRILLARADIAGPELAKGLQGLGAQVRSVVAYRTCAPAAGGQELRTALANRELDVVTFTSSSTVRHLVDMLLGENQLLQRPMIACIGPVTARTVRSLGLRVDVEARVHTVEGLVDALSVAWAVRSGGPAWRESEVAQ